MAKCRVPFSDQCARDLDFRIFVSGAYLLYYLRKESQIWYVHASWDDKRWRTILGSL